MLTVEKKCNVCGEVKKLSEFPKAKTCADGHRNKCKTCDYDRIDNTKGHTKDNCVTCCKLCNTTRMDNYTHEEFLKYIAPAIVALRKSRGDYDFEGN